MESVIGIKPCQFCIWKFVNQKKRRKKNKEKLYKMPLLRQITMCISQRLTQWQRDGNEVLSFYILWYAVWSEGTINPLCLKFYRSFAEALEKSNMLWCIVSLCVLTRPLVNIKDEILVWTSIRKSYASTTKNQ